MRRRPGDFVHLFLALVLMSASYWITDGFSTHHDRVYRWLVGLPGWIDALGTTLYTTCTIGGVVVVVGALLLTRNVRLACTLLGLAVLTALAAVLFASVSDLDEIRHAAGGDSAEPFVDSVVWLAVAIAVLLAVAPYLVRPVRRTVWVIGALAVAGSLLAGVGPTGSILGALGIGWAMAAIFSLTLGTPLATPTLGSVQRALAELGVSLVDLELADSQAWGESRFIGSTGDGAHASVVVIGRDAADARLFSRLWRSAIYRDAGPSVAASRSSQLEHRAYLVLMAGKAGVRVSDVVIAATAGPEQIALLVLLDPPGKPFSRVETGAIADTTLDDAWAQLDRLHHAQIAHGMIGPDTLLWTPGGSCALSDFSRSSIGGAPDLHLRDRIDLFVSTALVVGDERAVDTAGRVLGDDRLIELLPLMESAALSPAARRALPNRTKRLKELREVGAAWAGVEVPELTELRRVSPTSIVMAAATFLGFYLIVNQFEGVDLRATLATAELPWVFVAFALSITPNFFGTISVQGTVARPLPFGPLLAEQFANNFTGLIGGTVANTALVIRFFQKQGLKVAVAASSGVMNSVAGTVVELLLVGFALLFSNTDFSTPSGDGGGDLESLILLGIVGVGVLVSIVLLVPKLRNLLRHKLAPQVGAAKDNLRGILSDPRKAARIIGGNFCSQVAFALVIEAALHAYGASLPLTTIIVINTLASLVGGLAPVPGGMGVVEAGLIAGMTAAGIEQSTAVAATFTARLFTTYLSPIWGWFALSWLRRNDYI